MRVFLSHSSADKEIARRLASSLRAANIDVWNDESEMRLGDNIITKIQEGIESSDALVVLLSKSFASSNWMQHEISTWRLNGAVHAQKPILPVRLDDSPIPVFFADRASLDLRDGNVEEKADRFVDAIVRWRDKSSSKVASANQSPQPSEEQLYRLKREYVRGNLSLVCGAGVSMGAGIPGWNVLLRGLLTNLFRSGTPALADDVTADLARVYQSQFSTSPLIVAQYLKNALGKDYRPTLRDALYSSNPTTSPLIDAICDLGRPRRARQALHSIVTFNFDDLLEKNLQRNKVACAAIFHEGHRSEPHELPVYHVHGYLPRGGDVQDHELVFSEDAYHSQFIDPFSWSNLAQLSHFSSQTCLFIGLSMTDPNLRRLLDVSMRKNPTKQIRHYAFRRRYDPASMVSHFPAPDSVSNRRYAEILVNMAQILEESDANNLGISVIWVDSYDEIVPILVGLSDTHEAHL